MLVILTGISAAVVFKEEPSHKFSLRLKFDCFTAQICSRKKTRKTSLWWSPVNIWPLFRYFYPTFHYELTAKVIQSCQGRRVTCLM